MKNMIFLYFIRFGMMLSAISTNLTVVNSIMINYTKKVSPFTDEKQLQNSLAPDAKKKEELRDEIDDSNSRGRKLNLSLRCSKLATKFSNWFIKKFARFHTQLFSFFFLLNSNLISCALLLLFSGEIECSIHTLVWSSCAECWVVKKENFLVGGARTQPSEEERKLFIAQHFGVSLISAWVSGSFPKCNFPLSLVAFFCILFQLVLHSRFTFSRVQQASFSVKKPAWKWRWLKSSRGGDLSGVCFSVCGLFALHELA